ACTSLVPLLVRRPPTATLFPYTTLFRSLNMISTATMIQLGKVKGNKMIHMKLSNDKLVHRAQLMLVEELGIDLIKADELLKTYRSEEHTSELQSRENLVCRLLLEKNNPD